MLLLRGILGAKNELPFGKKGFYFAETGEHTWKSISEGISYALLAQAHGTTCSDKIESITLKDAADELGSSELLLELALAAKSVSSFPSRFRAFAPSSLWIIANKRSSRAKADNARELLGWKPVYGNESFHNHFGDELAAVSKEV